MGRSRCGLSVFMRRADDARASFERRIFLADLRIYDEDSEWNPAPRSARSAALPIERRAPIFAVRLHLFIHDVCDMP